MSSPKPSPSQLNVAVEEVRYRFFDVEVQIQSNSGKFLELVQALHRRGRAGEADVPPRQELLFRFARTAESSDHEWLLSIGGETYHLPPSRDIESHAYGQLLLMVVRAVRSHILVHAGAVSWADRGVVLLADSMQGKTTLALELVRRGFRLLSDDIAAFGRQDRRVYPFPRSLFIRQGTLELVGLPQPAESLLWYNDKIIVDVESLVPHSLGEPVPVRHIVLLSNPKAEPQPSGAPQLEVLLSRLPPDLRTATQRIAGVDKWDCVQEDGFPLLRLQVHGQAAVLNRLEELCRAHDVVVLDYRKEMLAPSDFRQPAELTSISHTAVVVEMLRGFRAGYRSNLFDDGLARPTQLFFELAAVANGATCHRLRVGPLPETADRVCELVAAEGKE